VKKGRIIEKHGIYHDGQFWLDDEAANKALDEHAQSLAKEVVEELSVTHQNVNDFSYKIEQMVLEHAIELIKAKFELK
jgi:hypothetical protein